jgi:hypothetical protein
MLYQLSYLGVSKGPRKRRRTIERAVYSGPERRCPAVWLDRQMLAESRLFQVLIVALGGRDHIGTAEPAVQIDIPATRRAERQRRLGGRLAADRTLLRLAAAGPTGGFSRKH